MPLNPRTSYYNIALLLQNNMKFSINRGVFSYKKDINGNTKWINQYITQLNSDQVFQKIIDAGIDKNHIHPGDWTSMSLETNPTAIRLRPSYSDEFLNEATIHRNGTFLIFSCVLINGIKTYFIVSSNYFQNYNFSKKSGNSFLSFDYANLCEFSIQNNRIRTKNTHISHVGQIPTFLYWTGNENDTNLTSLSTYLNILRTIPATGGFALRNPHLATQQTISPIPANIKTLCEERYTNLCALMSVGHCLTNTTNPNNPKEHHHIVPKNWFYSQNITDTQIVNNINNLILLCNPCHDKQTDRNINTRRMYFNYLLDSLRQLNYYDDFLQYLNDDVHLTLPLLERIYGL